MLLRKVGKKTIVDVNQIVYIQDGSINDNVPGKVVQKGVFIGLTGGHSVFFEDIDVTEFCKACDIKYETLIDTDVIVPIQEDKK